MPKPVIHGRDHGAGGADPAILNIDSTQNVGDAQGVHSLGATSGDALQSDGAGGSYWSAVVASGSGFDWAVFRTDSPAATTDHGGGVIEPIWDSINASSGAGWAIDTGDNRVEFGDDGVYAIFLNMEFGTSVDGKTIAMSMGAAHTADNITWSSVGNFFTTRFDPTMNQVFDSGQTRSTTYQTIAIYTGLGYVNTGFTLGFTENLASDPIALHIHCLVVRLPL